MTPQQVRLFLNSFDDPFWQDFAELHFFMAGRAQEVGGLQWSSVDFERRILRVEDVSVWSYYDRNFSELKETPKMVSSEWFTSISECWSCSSVGGKTDQIWPVDLNESPQVRD